MPVSDDLSRLHKTGVNLIAIPGPVNRQQHDQIARLNAAARSNSLPIECVARVEWMTPKLGFADLTAADLGWFCLLDPIVSESDWNRMASLRTAATVPLAWNDFVPNVLSTVRQIPAFVVPEFNLTPMMAYRVFDESVVSPYAFQALIAVDEAGRDAVRRNPDLERWIGRLPLVPSGPVHGNLDEWLNDPSQSRVVFWARGHRLADFLDAVRTGLVVCVIRSVDDSLGVTYYGRPDLVDHLKLRLDDWQWWKPKTTPVQSASGETHE
jgi:hypothetical protein